VGHYLGGPQTEGFDAIRMPARSLGIGLLLEDGHVAWGDMMSVQYAGAGGRERVFDTASAQALVNVVLTERRNALPWIPFAPPRRPCLRQRPTAPCSPCRSSTE
jgi:hypothetical protein